MNPDEIGILQGLSPEEILARKEREGGIVYDDPFIPESPVVQTPTREDLEARQTPPYAPPHVLDPALDEIRSKSSAPLDSRPPDLGRVEPQRVPQSEFSPGLEFGWKNLPLSVLPSK